MANQNVIDVLMNHLMTETSDVYLSVHQKAWGVSVGLYSIDLGGVSVDVEDKDKPYWKSDGGLAYKKTPFLTFSFQGHSCSTWILPGEQLSFSEDVAYRGTARTDYELLDWFKSVLSELYRVYNRAEKKNRQEQTSPADCFAAVA